LIHEHNKTIDNEKEHFMDVDRLGRHPYLRPDSDNAERLLE
jgi:hypothetical protein